MKANELTKQKKEIIKIAEQILNKDINYIIGCREISRLLYGLFEDSYIEKYFSIFSTISSDTDHLPIGEYRKQWNKEILKKKDKEIQEKYEFYKKYLIDGLSELIDELKN